MSAILTLAAGAASKSCSTSDYIAIITLSTLVIAITYHLIFDRDDVRCEPPSNEAE